MKIKNMQFHTINFVSDKNVNKFYTTVFTGCWRGRCLCERQATVWWEARGEEGRGRGCAICRLAIRDGIVKGRRRNSPSFISLVSPVHPAVHLQRGKATKWFVLNLPLWGWQVVRRVWWDIPWASWCVRRRTMSTTYRTSLLSSHYLIPKTVRPASCCNLQLATQAHPALGPWAWPWSPGRGREWSWGQGGGLVTGEGLFWVVGPQPLTRLQVHLLDGQIA